MSDFDRPLLCAELVLPRLTRRQAKTYTYVVAHPLLTLLSLWRVPRCTISRFSGILRIGAPCSSDQLHGAPNHVACWYIAYVAPIKVSKRALSSP